MTTDDTCRTCAQVTGTKRYCAPARCYCGHRDCPASESYVDLATVALPNPPQAPVVRAVTSSWDDREESTWIDKL